MTARARAASLAAALVLLGVGVPAQVQGVEELLETLIPVLPTSTGFGTPVTGTAPLRQGATYRVVVTGIITLTIQNEPRCPAAGG